MTKSKQPLNSSPNEGRLGRPESQAFASKRIPLYYQLENLLRERISAGAFAVGDQLPTENELMGQFQVSQATVRKALAALVREGVIERRQGVGTFIAERPARQRAFQGEIHLTGSLGEIIAMGLTTSVEMIELNRIAAHQHEAELLQLPPGAAIYRFKRIRKLDGKPYVLIINYLPAEIGKRLTRRDLSHGSLIQKLETKLGLQLDGARQQITAALADPYVAGALEIPVGSALLSIEQAVYTTDGKPVAFLHALYRSDLFHYSVYLKHDRLAGAKPRTGGKKA
jgi:GntR family transcriptional regulator